MADLETKRGGRRDRVIAARRPRAASLALIFVLSAGTAAAQSAATWLLNLAASEREMASAAEPASLARARRQTTAAPRSDAPPVETSRATPAAALLRIALDGEASAADSLESFHRASPSAPQPQLSAVYAAASRSARAALAAAAPPAAVPGAPAPSVSRALATAQTSTTVSASEARASDVRRPWPDRTAAASAAAIAGPAAVPALTATAAAEARASYRRPAHQRMAAASAAAIADPTAFQTATSGVSRFDPNDGVAAVGDGLDSANRLLRFVPGLRIEQASLFGGYSSSALPQGRLAFGSGLGRVGSDGDFGGRATLAYGKQSRLWTTRLVYTPSRTQRARWTEWNSTDHIAHATVSRQLSRRMSVTGTARAGNTGMEQFAFRLPQFHFVENPPLSFEELSERVEAGEFTDEEFASTLTGAPVIDDPGGRVLGLGRAISLGGSGSLSYAPTARTNLRFGADARSVRIDRIPRRFVGDQENALFVQNVDQRGAFMEYERRMGPGFSVGARLRARQFESTFGGATTQSARAFASKRLSRHWRVEGEGGLAAVRVSAAGAAAADLSIAGGLSFLPTGRGQLIYQGRSQAWQASYGREAGNSVGLAARSTDTYQMRWNWQPARSAIGYFLSASRRESRLAMLGSPVGLKMTMVNAGVVNRLGPTTLLETGYYYGVFDSPFRGLLSGISIHRVQSTITWRPAAESR